MGKVFGIVIIVLAVWVGIEVYTKGTHEAFGGALAWFEQDGASNGAPVDERSTMRRIGDNVRGNLNAGAARTSNSDNPEAQLDDGDVMGTDADDLEE